MKKALGVAAVNIAVFLCLYAIVEGGSWAVIKFYSGRADTPVTVAGDGDDKLELYSSKAVGDDLAARHDMTGSPMRYETYVVYTNRPYRSAHVNVSENSERLNGRESPANAEEVWVFGSSALFGVSSGDDETIPAYMEATLSAELGRPIHVRNFGVEGYTSWQDLINFSIRLWQYTPFKPKLVVFFNGVNDHYRAFINEADDCRHLLYTGVGSREVLEQAWEDRSRGRIISWPSIADPAKRLFQHTTKLIDLAENKIDLKVTNGDIAAWRKAYSARRERTKAITSKCSKEAGGIYLRNMKAAARLARDNGIAIAFAHQPLLFMTKKPLVGSEISEFNEPDNNVFALTDKQLAALHAVPAFRLNQLHLWDRSQFIEAYEGQRRDLLAMCREMDVPCVVVDPELDKAGAVLIFSSQVHFTFRGARIVGQAIARPIEDLLR